MGICPSKTKKRTTKSKNFGKVNFVLNKHRVQNVLGSKNQKPLGSSSWIQHWEKNSGQGLPPNCPICLKIFQNRNQIFGAHVYISEKKIKNTRLIQFIIPACYGYLMSDLNILKPLIINNSMQQL